MRKIWLVALIAVLSLFTRSALAQSFTALPYNVPYQYGGETYPWAIQAQIDSNNSYVFYCKNTAGDPSVDFNSSTTFLLRFGGGYAWSQAGYCQLVYTENGGTSWGNVTVNGYWYFGNSEISSFSQLRSHRGVKYNGYSSGNLVNNYTNSNFGVSGINQGDVLTSGSSFADGPKTFRNAVGSFRANTNTNGGQCVVYIRSETDIPWADFNGDAQDTFVQAMNAGYAVSIATPRVSSIIVFSAQGNMSVGHVGIVTAINGNNLTIRDSNWNLDEIVREHVIDVTNYSIIGYIYHTP